ncbi:MAG: prefoldin subunit alpha [Thermoplasmatota archaeon]
MESSDKASSGRELQMGIAQLEQYKAQLEAMRSQREAMAGVLLDYRASMEVLDVLENGADEELLIPIGGMVFVKASIADKGRCIVEQGSGIYMDQDVASSKKLMRDRMDKIEEAVAGYDQSINEMLNRYNELAQKTQELYNNQMLSGQGPEGTF